MARRRGFLLVSVIVALALSRAVQNFSWCLQSPAAKVPRQRPLLRVCLHERAPDARHSRTALSAVPPSDLIAEKWSSEAERCWGPDEDGVSSGLIPDMVPAGVQYDPALKRYYAAEKPRITIELRPWQSISAEERQSRAGGIFPTHEQEKDFKLAMQMFDRGEPGAEQGSIVVDMACGEALMARRFAQSRKFELVFAVDIMWEQLGMARRHAEVELTGPADGLFLLRSDVQNLPFKDGQVDFVWWGLGVHMVNNQNKALESIKAVLKPGGRLVATTRPYLLDKFELKMMGRDAGFANVTVNAVAPGTREERLVLSMFKP